MEEKSWGRNHGGEINGQKSGKGNHEGEIMEAES